MKWFSGDIAQAVNLAKSSGAIFVVYSEGSDENSKRMTELINSENVSSRLESKSFVAIKIQSDKEEYINFAKIYQLVPVPSIFFIRNGVPIKIVTETVKTASELEEAIDFVESPQQQKTAGPESSTSSSKPDNAEVICDGDICYRKEKESEPASSSSESPNDSADTEIEKQEKIKKAMKLIEQKRVERVQEEQRLEKEREIQRRKEGQQVQDLKKWQNEQELKQLKEDRLKDKLEAKAARQRVLDQIAEDKKERAQRFGMQAPSTPAEPKASPVTPTEVVPNSARIQFKKPDGETEVVTFDSDMLFSDLHLFVKNDVLHGSLKEFTLALTFPRREFTQLDFDKTLANLNLTPSAVLLILPKRPTSINTNKPSSILPTQTDGSLMSMLGALFFGFFSPVMALFAYLKTFVVRNQEPTESANDAGKRKRNEEVLAPNDAAKKRNLSAFEQPAPGPSTQSSSSTGTIPKSGAYKRQNPSNNIHRLHQNSDSEDEDRKTYNGNSTQQM